MSDKFDAFVTNSVYPDTGEIFSFKVCPIEDLKNRAVIVLDTNVLLIPYTIGKESLGKIHDTYRTLVNENRLIIPGQVAREFATHRATKLSELYQQLSRKMNNAASPLKGRYPLLEDLASYQKITEIETRIDSLLEEYRKAIDAVLREIRNWTWNDPVSNRSASLFSDDVVFDLAINNKENILEELERRRLHKIPPGYKDARKDDNGIGDLLIWLSILEIGQKRNTDLIFVSGDDKADWWHRSEKKPLYPRHELVDEYRRSSGGKSFHIVSFSDFLNLYGASDTIVKEVGQQEKEARLNAGVEEARFSRLERDSARRGLVRRLKGSDTYRETRTALRALSKYTPSLTKSEINTIVEAVVNNDQIYGIISDNDINGYVRAMIRGREEQIEPGSYEIISAVLDGAADSFPGFAGGLPDWIAFLRENGVSYSEVPPEIEQKYLRLRYQREDKDDESL